MMDHDISHCTGIKEDPVCEECVRRKAHEELKQLVHQGKTPTGKVYRYVNPETCESLNYAMCLSK